MTSRVAGRMVGADVAPLCFWELAAITVVVALAVTLDPGTGQVAAAVAVSGFQPPAAVRVMASTGRAVDFTVGVSSLRIAARARGVVLSIRMRALRAARVGVGVLEGGWPDPSVIGVPLCTRGEASGYGGVIVSMPASSVTTLSYKVRYAAAPWPGLRPSLRPFANVPAVNPGRPATQLGTIRLRTSGPTGIRILLSLRGGIRSLPGTSYPRVRRGRRVVITGSTMPAIVNAPVRLWADSYAQPSRDSGLRRTPIGTTTVSAAGRFRISWRPQTAGL